MTSKWQWILSIVSRKLWIRVALFALLAVIVPFFSMILRPIIPDNTYTNIGGNSVDEILNILASSMLTVTTFSLNIMISAYSSATNNVTPRATRLLMEDSTTQNVLATFIGSFLFSLVGIITINAGIYDHKGRFILFIVSIVIVILIVITLLKWIQHLSLLGRVTETSSRIEKTTAKALIERAKNPYLGANPWYNPNQRLKDVYPIYSQSVGYVTHIDMKAISDYADTNQIKIYIKGTPGIFIHPSKPVLLIQYSKDSGSIDINSLLNAITINSTRSFDQDPRFGLAVLTEIASKAINTNDKGTVIDVLGRAMRLLIIWDKETTQYNHKVLFPLLYACPIYLSDLFDDIFTPIARDGAANIEIQIILQKTLMGLAKSSPGKFMKEAKKCSINALTISEISLPFESDKQRLRHLVKHF
ncbi:MAG: DUF2254 domain-containing protein [Solitalea-like symbiont of Acarus siro]